MTLSLYVVGERKPKIKEMWEKRVIPNWCKTNKKDVANVTLNCIGIKREEINGN